LIPDISSFESIQKITATDKALARKVILAHPKGGQDILEMLGLAELEDNK